MDGIGVLFAISYIGYTFLWIGGLMGAVVNAGDVEVVFTHSGI
jgi:hypothetical protein